MGQEKLSFARRHVRPRSAMGAGLGAVRSEKFRFEAYEKKSNS
jgi:hypothetical protein